MIGGALAVCSWIIVLVVEKVVAVEELLLLLLELVLLMLMLLLLVSLLQLRSWLQRHLKYWLLNRIRTVVDLI